MERTQTLVMVVIAVVMTIPDDDDEEMWRTTDERRETGGKGNMNSAQKSDGDGGDEPATLYFAAGRGEGDRTGYGDYKEKRTTLRNRGNNRKKCKDSDENSRGRSNLSGVETIELGHGEQRRIT